MIKDSLAGLPDISGEFHLPSSSLPHNTEAEQSLLSALLHHNKAFERVGEFLKPAHFLYESHQKIYQAITYLIEGGVVADPLSLKELLAKKGILEDVGGIKYLVHLATNLSLVGSTLDYADIIYDLAVRRSLIQISQDLMKKAQALTLDNPAEKHIEWAEQELFELSTKWGASRSGFISFSTALANAVVRAEEAFQREDKIIGTSSGLKDLDKWLGGLHPSDLIILAGRPSMGKTALATNIAYNAAKTFLKGKGAGVTAFFSLEMSSSQLAARLLAQESGVASDRIRRGEINQEDLTKLVKTSREMEKVPLHIDDTPALTLSTLRSRVRRLKIKYGLGLIVVDYLQLLQSSGPNKNDTRVNEVSQITRGLKALAKEMNVPIIALSQLSRAVEAREDKRPQLSDLRESGSIEQDADVVMFVYREEYYIARQEVPEDHIDYDQWIKKMADCYNLAEIIFAKQRHGPIGTIRLFYNASLTKFGDFEPAYS